MKTKQMNDVAMKVNQANLVKSLRFSFTQKTTVLSELMQNARRAQATQVIFNFCSETKVLQVMDDGCGIGSMETLLTVAESGWAADLIDHECCFGIGFLSALFACQYISVTSKGGSMTVDTEEVLAFKPVTITPVEDWDGVTTITLHEVDLDTDNITRALRRLARGFPIPVIFNGDTLERAAAVDSGLEFVMTAIGAVYLQGLQEPIGAQFEFDVFLQGLPIYSSHNYASERHIVHLDSARFHARLPDRDKLVNEAEVVNEVKAVLAVEIEKRLRQLKAEKTPEEFVLYYGMMRHWHLLGLLNDVPVVPIEALSEITDYPVCDTEIFDNFERQVGKPMARAEIEARGIVSIDDDMRTEGAGRYLLAREKDYLIYNHGKLDSGHWLLPVVQDLNAEELVIECINETHQVQFQGAGCWLPVRFCEAYRIKLGGAVVEITEDAVYQGQDHGEYVIVPTGDGSAQVLSQVSSYRNEWDEHQQSTYEADCDAFIAFVVANTTSDPAQALKRLLPAFCGCPSLYGKSFALALDGKGAVSSVAALSTGLDALSA